MDDRPTVLIVASDQAMRRSLAFVLEAEGYAVVATAQREAGAWPPGHSDQFCVAVVDQDALVVRTDPAAELAKLNRPVILLVERMRRPPALPGLRIIEKPPLGRDLLDAVAAALEAARTT